MSLVVADTSPIHYLLQIGVIDLLPSLYGSILIPDAVLLELNHQQAPLIVKTWVRGLPAWVAVTPRRLRRTPHCKALTMESSKLLVSL